MGHRACDRLADDLVRTGEAPTGAGVPERAGVAGRPVPSRNATMTASNDTPTEGHESIDSKELANDWRALDGQPDELIALVLEDQKGEAKEAAADVTRALLNDDEPLTDEKVDNLMVVGHALRSISHQLATRVPDDRRAELE